MEHPGAALRHDSVLGNATEVSDMLDHAHFRAHVDDVDEVSLFMFTSQLTRYAHSVYLHNNSTRERLFILPSLLDMTQLPKCWYHTQMSTRKTMYDAQPFASAFNSALTNLLFYAVWHDGFALGHCKWQLFCSVYSTGRVDDQY